MFETEDDSLDAFIPTLEPRIHTGPNGCGASHLYGSDDIKPFAELERQMGKGRSRLLADKLSKKHRSRSKRRS